MKTEIFVISDLHLGGDEQYQICGRESQELLASFLAWVARQASDRSVHLVVNGDSVDFLAEREFTDFTGDEEKAAHKLENIFSRSREVWDAFRAVAQAGAQVTLIMGNHDLELSLPEPRRKLLDRLGPGNVEFIYDNQALAVGDVLIEHGNQYDRWNKVDDDGLRHFRAAVSRRNTPQRFEAPPGSRLVYQVINDLKRDFGFINMLKPENHAAIPLLGVLRPSALKSIRRFAPLLAATLRVDTEAVAGRAEGSSGDLHSADEKALLLANELAFEGDMGAVSGSLLMEFRERWHTWATGEKRRRQVQAVGKALHYWASANVAAFDTQQEAPEYLKAATRSARSGFRVVIYGHTHLPKRIPVVEGSGTYLNSGTWADLMYIPGDLLTGDAGTAKELEMFVDDLVENRLDKWVVHLPTFVRVKLENDRTTEADVWLYRGEDHAERLPEGPLAGVLRRADRRAL